jgi:hypothetical protein
MEEAQMSDYIIFRCIMDYALILFGIWAIAAIVTNALFAEMKRRPRIGASKRQGKLYIHSIADDR